MADNDESDRLEQLRGGGFTDNQNCNFLGCTEPAIYSFLFCSIHGGEEEINSIRCRLIEEGNRIAAAVKDRDILKWKLEQSVSLNRKLLKGHQEIWTALFGDQVDEAQIVGLTPIDGILDIQTEIKKLKEENAALLERLHRGVS